MTKSAKFICCIAGSILLAGCSHPPLIVLQAPTLLNPVCMGPSAKINKDGKSGQDREVAKFEDGSERVLKHLTVYVPLLDNGDAAEIDAYRSYQKTTSLEASVLEKTLGKHAMSVRNLTFNVRCNEFFCFLPGLLVNALWEYSNERAFSEGGVYETDVVRDPAAAAPLQSTPASTGSPSPENNVK
jgi:hypothetical protein